MERGADTRSRGSFLYRRGELAVLLSLMGLALLLMLLTNSTQAGIARHVEDFVLSPFRAVDRGLRQMRSLLESNHELEAELTAARLELVRTEEMRLENERLRAMLGLEARAGFKLIGCEVLAEGAGRLGGMTVLLDSGYNQGIREGMALVTRDGLAGKVVEVRPNRAHALLLTHPDCAVAARVERSRVGGIVEWLPGSSTSLKLRNISYLADVQLGDRVVSSGLGGVFPASIPVGTVTKIDKDVTGLVLDITLRPAIPFRALEEVFALESTGAGDPAASPESGAGPVFVPAPPVTAPAGTAPHIQRSEAGGSEALPAARPSRAPGSAGARPRATHERPPVISPPPAARPAAADTPRLEPPPPADSWGPAAADSAAAPDAAPVPNGAPDPDGAPGPDGAPEPGAPPGPADDGESRVDWPRTP